MSVKFPSGLPSGLMEALRADLAKQFPDLDVEVVVVGQEDAAAPDDIKAASGGDGDGMAQHRYHLIEKVLENFDDFESVDQVINAADKLFQYITNGTVPA